ncbi:MAG: AEC family transporter [Oscillospiraceae bacterium]|nr:AEC family transporter [Oscillospiraceae bacterium]
MFKVFTATLSPMLVMFTCMVAGFVLNKKKLLPANATAVLSKLENFILVPALIIRTFMKYCTVASLREQYRLVLYSAGAVAIAIGIAYALSGLFERDAYRKNIYRYALTFGNFGFMGNAIVPAILGEAMLYDHLLFTLPMNLAAYVWGVSILIPPGKGGGSPLKNLLNPTVFAIAIGMALGLLGLEPAMPAFFTSTLDSLSGCMGPIAMVLTGFVIGDYDFGTLLKNKKVYAAAALRLLVFPALYVALFMLLGADEKTLTLCLFAFATPLGLNTVVFPAAYGGDTSTGASMAMVSHTLCVLTIPLMYALLSAVLH